jgi:hypothetical protein
MEAKRSKTLMEGGATDSFPDDIPDEVVNLQLPEPKEPNTFLSSQRHSSHTSDDLSQKWSIGLKQAYMTLKATDQRGTRSAVLPMSRRYRHDRWFGRRRLNATIGTDFFYARYKSHNQNVGAQFFGGGDGRFVDLYPGRSKALAADGLVAFINDWGRPREIVADGASEQIDPKTALRKPAQMRVFN